MKSFLFAIAAGAIVWAAGTDNTAVADGGYFYAPPAYYAGPPDYVVRPVYYAPPVAYYPLPFIGTSVRYKRTEIKVREYTPWGVRKYEWEYKGHGVWELDD